MKKYLPIMILLICVATALGAAQAIQFSNVMFGAYEDRPTAGRFPGDLYIVTSRIGATTPIPWVAMWDSNAADWAALAGTSGDYGADQAGAIWFEDSAIYSEGATDDAYEYIIAFADTTADRTLTLPDVAATAFILNVFADGGSAAIADAGAAMTFTLADVAAAGTGANILTLAYTPSAMDGSGDTTRGVYIDANGAANHTSGTSVLLDIDNNTNDAQSTDIGIRIDADFDEHIMFLGNGQVEFVDAGYVVFRDPNSNSRLFVNDVAAAGTGEDIVEIDQTLSAMNGHADTFRSLYIDVTAGAHTAGNYKMIDLDLNSNDAQSYDIGIKVNANFDAGIQSAAPVLVRENFDHPFIVLEEDYTAKVLTDNGINTVFGSPSGIIEYYEEVAKTASSWVIADKTLDISADDGAGDNEGFELMLGDDDDATSGWLVAQTDSLCFSVNATTALIAGTDQFVIGWRTSEAFQDAGAVANYTTFAYVGQTNLDGSIFLYVDDGDSANDDSGVNIANASTNTYKVCMEADGGAAGYLNGTEITNTNTTAQLITAGTNMVPFISYLCISGTDAGIAINWWEITAESH